MSFVKWMSLFGLLLTILTWQYVNVLMATTNTEAGVKNVPQVKTINALNMKQLR